MLADKREEVRSRVQADPHVSVRRLMQQVPRTTLHRTLRALKLKPYRMCVRQELKAPDLAKRIAYCEWFQRFVHDGADRLDNVYFTDEAWVHLDGYINAQNYRVWSQENPHEYRETGLHPQKVGIWCAISRNRIIGPIFFAKTVNAQRYREIIREFVMELPLADRMEGKCVYYTLYSF